MKKSLLSLIGIGLMVAGCSGAGVDLSVDDEPLTQEEILVDQELQAALANADGVAPGRYIVTLEDGVEPEDVVKDHGVAPAHLFKKAIRGFAGSLNSAQVDALDSDSRVAYVEPDRAVTIEKGNPHNNPPAPETTTETLPTGIDRIDAELNPRTDVSGIGVAIIDTGIWLTHSDLNVQGNVTFVSASSSGNDDNGHGTHCAGIAAAKTNDNRGVRGVAPNARLYAVKVLNRSGSGYISWIIAGVDWVTQNAASKGIDVANMSLGFAGSSFALDQAISNSIAAGVTYAVAAGNEDTDASSSSPANHPSVITVSAMGDSDGSCGADGSNTSYSVDDGFASFSNYGSSVEIAAPGVDILSTWKGSKSGKSGSYATISGTSMASPHVAGAAAQYIASHPSATPSQVRSALISEAVSQSASCIGDGDGGFSGDPDSSHEPLLYAKDL